MAITITITPSKEFLAGIIITAVEGGIGYWSCCSGYKFSGCDDADDADSNPALEFAEVTVHESVDDIDYDGETIEGRRGGEYKAKGVFVGMAEIEAALAKVCDLSQPIEHLGDQFRASVIKALQLDDCGDLDAGDCDTIMQIAVLGGIVYG